MLRASRLRDTEEQEGSPSWPDSHALNHLSVSLLLLSHHTLSRTEERLPFHVQGGPRPPGPIFLAKHLYLSDYRAHIFSNSAEYQQLLIPQPWAMLAFTSDATGPKWTRLAGRRSNCS